MTAPNPSNRTEHSPSPNAERLRIAMGWDRLPVMTPEEEKDFRAKCERAWEEARRFYGTRAT